MMAFKLSTTVQAQMLLIVVIRYYKIVKTGNIYVDFDIYVKYSDVYKIDNKLSNLTGNMS